MEGLFFDDELCYRHEILYLDAFSHWDRDWVATRIAALIRGIMAAVEPSRRTLEEIARRFGVVLRWESDVRERGTYFAPLSEGDVGRIVLWRGLSLRSRWRAFFHELAHHLMWFWVGPDSYEADCVTLTGPQRSEVELLRHPIARRVEALLLEGR